MSQLPAAVARRLRLLPDGLREHVGRSRCIAQRLAERHGVDRAPVDLAVAAHDLAKPLRPDELLALARSFGLEVHPVEAHRPALLHGSVAARWLEIEDGVSDRDVLDAVRYHTTGRKGMSRTAKVVFLADKLDPHKVSRKPRLEKVETLAPHSLDAALLEYLNGEMAHLLRRGALIHPYSFGLRNALAIAALRKPAQQ